MNPTLRTTGTNRPRKTVLPPWVAVVPLGGKETLGGDEQLPAVPLEEAPAVPPTDPVPDVVAQDGTDDGDRGHEREPEVAERRIDSAEDDERLARHDDARADRVLQERRGADDDVSPRRFEVRAEEFDDPVEHGRQV